MIYSKMNTDFRTALTLMPDCHIGNLVVSLPAIVALQKHFQDLQHYLVVDEAFKEIVEPLIDPEYTLFYPRKQTNNGSYFKRIAAYFNFILQVRRIKPDIVIDLEGGKTSAAITRISKAGVCVSRANADRKSLYSLLVPLPSGRHKVFAYTEIAAAVGAEIDQKPFRFYPDPGKKIKINKMLEDSGLIMGKPIVAIHPGAGRIQKLWTISGFVEVADWLSDQGFQVVFIGGPAEMTRTDQIMAQISGHVHNFVGKLSLGELLPLLERSKVFLGNDSGPMHMAAAMGTAVVAIFSYADEREWGPRSERFIVLRGQPVCATCINKQCRNPECINTLRPALVKKALSSF